MTVTINEIFTKPKNTSKKKFFLKLKLLSLPNPEIETKRKTILMINISI